jgi:beta-lactamase superfamily II metal-dependent hydrolase
MTTLSAAFLDVGVGDCTLITLPDGTHMLVDVYRRPEQGSVDLFKVLRDVLATGPRGKQRLEYLVITHAHDDHIWGIGDLAEEFEIGQLWVPQYGTKKDLSSNYEAFVKVVENHPDEDRVWQKGSRSPVAELADETVTVRCFSPPGYINVEEELNEDEQRKVVHEHCGVYRLTFAGTSLMLTGDSNLPAWKRIVGYYNDHQDDDRLAVLGATVLHASHHGSRTFVKDAKDDEPWTEALKAIDPEHIVISVGADNTHEHPHADMLAVYDETAEIHRTDQDATIVLTIEDDGAFSIETDASYITNYGWDEDGEQAAASKGRSDGRIPPPPPPPNYETVPQRAPRRERYA